MSPSPNARAPFMSQLQDIEARCRDLSSGYRLGMPPELIRDRFDQLAPMASEMLHGRNLQICYLLDQCGSLRFNELRRMLGRISTRTLAAKLAYLQDKGMVVRDLFDDNPPRVEYRLTGNGQRFTNLLFPSLVCLSQAEKPNPATVPA